MKIKLLSSALAGALICVTLGSIEAQTLQPTRLPAGAGVIGLPAGWNIEPSMSVDMVSASGPQGHVDLGIYVQMYTPQAADQMARVMYGHRPNLVGPYENPAQALINLYVATNTARPGAIRILERSRDTYWKGPGENLLLVDTYTQQECLVNVLSSSTGGGQFMLYQSRVCAPQSQFARVLPVLLRIWSSWHLSDSVYQARLLSTAMSLNTVSNIISGVAQRRGLAGANQAQIWDKIIKGCANPYYHPQSPWCELPPD